MNASLVLIGTCDWQYPQWASSYYPDGLPEEWRLAYYGNEYPVVMLPASCWWQRPAMLEASLSEMDERPLFICEWRPAQDSQQLAALNTGILNLGERALAVMICLQHLPSTSEIDMLNRLAQAYALCLDWPGATLAQIDSLRAQLAEPAMLSVCWNGDSATVTQLDTGRLLLARVNTAGQTPRNLRSLLEILMEKANGRQAVLLFDGTPPDLDIVDQAETIFNLL